MYKRFKWNPQIRYEDFWIPDLANIKNPSRIFVGSTMELFGDWIKYWWLKTVFDFALLYPQHTFIFLTKRPENLIKWSPFPTNCWVGVSVTNDEQFTAAIVHLENIKASVKFISFEPLLGEIGDTPYLLLMLRRTISWVIIGQQTPVKMSTMPQLGWVENIVREADKAGIRVFLKDNLISCVDQYDFALKDGKYRQEFPV